MMKCKERIIPDEDRIDTMGIIKLINMDLEEIRKNYLIADGSITIFLSERLIMRLTQWKCKWMDLGYININYEVDCTGHKDLDVSGQIFGYEIRLLHQWGMDIANIYRIQFEEATYLLPFKWSHNYIDTDNSDEFNWNVYGKSLGGKSIMNASEFCKGITNRIYGLTSMSPLDVKYILEDEKIMRNTVYDRLFNRFFDNKAPIFKAFFDIEKVIFNGPATIVVWKDNTKTVVKCEEGTTYSKEEAIDQAILKKLFTTNSHHKRVLKDLINERSVEQIDKKKLKKEHTNYVLETIRNYINGKSEE